MARYELSGVQKAKIEFRLRRLPGGSTFPELCEAVWLHHGAAAMDQVTRPEIGRQVEAQRRHFTAGERNKHPRWDDTEINEKVEERLQGWAKEKGYKTGLPWQLEATREKLDGERAETLPRIKAAVAAYLVETYGQPQTDRDGKIVGYGSDLTINEKKHARVGNIGDFAGVPAR